METTDIKVTVIIPVYNAADYLAPAMDSIICQTLTDIEIICVDDGSTDASLDVIRDYGVRDERIKIVTQAHSGPAVARNRGLRLAGGKYVIFLDADDFYEPTLLEELYGAAEKSSLEVVIADYDIFNSHKSVFERTSQAEHEEIYEGREATSKNEFPDVIFSSTNGAAWNKLFKRSFVLEKGLLFLADVKMYEDVYFTVTALSLAERVGKVHKILIHHRVYSEQSRAKLFRKYYSQVPMIFAKIKEFLMKKGMYSPLVTSYLNLSASRCYKIYNILGSDAKEHFWNMLHGEYIEALGWQGTPSSEYEESEVFEFVASIELYDHKQYKRRVAQGRHARTVALDRNVRSKKKMRRFNAILAKIFGKEK